MCGREMINTTDVFPRPAVVKIVQFGRKQFYAWWKLCLVLTIGGNCAHHQNENGREECQAGPVKKRERPVTVNRRSLLMRYDFFCYRNIKFRMKYNYFNCWNWSLKSGFICWRFTKKMDLKEWNLQKDWQSWLLCYIAWHNDEAANGWQCWQKWSCLVISVKRAETRKMESAAESAISSCGRIVFSWKNVLIFIFCLVLIVRLSLVQKKSFY